MAGHCGFFQRSGGHLLYLATTTWERVCTSGKLSPWEAGFLQRDLRAVGLGCPSGSPKHRDEVRGLDHGWAMLFFTPRCVAFC